MDSVNYQREECKSGAGWGLYDKDEKIIQIAFLPNVTRENYDSDYFVVGGAVSDKGKLYPIVFDGFYDLQVYDPLNDSLWEMSDKIAENLERRKSWSTAYNIFYAFMNNHISYEEAAKLVEEIPDGEQREKASKTLSMYKEIADRRKEREEKEAAADLPFDD